MDWFRSWHGAPTDNKWLVIAKRAGTQPGIVSAIVWALLDHASQAEVRGHIGDSFDIETYSVFSGFPEETVIAVLNALQDKGILDGNGDFSAWARRQPKREDETATERKRRERDRKKGNGPNPDVTHGHAMSRNVTQGHAPEEIREEKRRTDKKEAIASSPPLGGVGGGWPENGFELFLEAFAHRVDLGAAEREYRKIVGTFPFDILLAAARNHHLTESTSRRMNPSNWLAKERWKDAPAAAPMHPANRQQDNATTRRLLKHAEQQAQRAGLHGGLIDYDPTDRSIQSPRARALGYGRAPEQGADPTSSGMGHKPAPVPQLAGPGRTWPGDPETATAEHPGRP